MLCGSISFPTIRTKPQLLNLCVAAGIVFWKGGVGKFSGCLGSEGNEEGEIGESDEIRDGF